MPAVLVSGGFDPYHDGHAELIQRASEYGNVVVALNSDAWLTRKKGRPFMNYEARRKVMESVKGVTFVYPVEDDDGTVCEAVEALRPDYFANGGDRTETNTPESELCERLGIKLIYGLGKKVSSSSELTKRHWGTYVVLHEEAGFKVKILRVRPGGSTSLQSHKFRNEHWINPEADTHEYHKAGETHQLTNPSKEVLTVIEVQTGSYFGEDDITRFTENNKNDNPNQKQGSRLIG